jgi:PmbA protein
MATKEVEKINETLTNVLDLMKKAGADYAEASFSSSEQRSVTVRLGHVENLETSKSMGIGLMMRVGDKSEEMSISSRSLQDLSDAVSKLAVSLKLKPDNIHDRPLDESLFSKVRHNRSLDLINRSKASIDTMIARAKEAEAAALAMPKIANSDGASASWGRSLTISRDSSGAEFMRERSSHSLSVAVIAQEGDDQQRGGEWSGAVYLEDMMSPAEIGVAAALDAARALNPRPALQGQFPVVFHPDIGSSLLGHFAGAISGGSVRKKSSFLCEAMGQAVFAPGISIHDNPHLKRGMSSTRFSGSGMPTKPMKLVENGVLKSWLLDLENARRLGIEITDKVRGSTNMTIEPGTVTPDQLIADIQDGLYVTGLMGQGVDVTSGSYSRAAKGFLIKNGAIDFNHPVDNVSVSSNLADMFRNMSVANDLNRLRNSKAVPTLRVEGMSIA